MNKYINTKDNDITVFSTYCIENFPFIEEDFDSITNYQMLCKVVEYLNKVINQTNINTDEVNKLKELYVELKNYVDTYFDNLDIQTEINNKLDQMAIDGTLTDIIAQYLKLAGVLSYDTVNEMKEATNLENGSIAHVLGNKTINDGFGGYYKISDTGKENSLYTIKLNNNLFANLINNINDNFYNEISYTINRKDNTDYYLTTIPKYDNDNNLIELYIGEAKDNEDKSPNKYARKNLTSFTCNATLAIQDTDGIFYDSIVISNGEVINPAHTFENRLSDDYRYVCIDKDRNFTSYQANITDSSTMIADGVMQAFICFYQLIENGIYTPHTGNDEFNVRQVLGIKEDGTVIVLTVDGRSSTSIGFNETQCANILIELGVKNAYFLDGGGSTSTSIRTFKINRNVDDSMTKDRNIKYTLNAKKTIANKSIANTYSFISEQKNQYNKQIMEYINSLINIQDVNISRTTFSLPQDDYEKINISKSMVGYSTNNIDIIDNNFVVKKAGVYKFSGTFEIVSSGDTAGYFKPCHNSIGVNIQKFSKLTGNTYTIPINFVINCSAGDIINIQYYGNIGDYLNRGSLNYQYFGN